MSGYPYGDDEPTQLCPYCKTVCRADYVDIGVGMEQCGPFHCEECGASQIGSFDEKRELSDIENKCGWYAPESEPGSSANVINGKIVSYAQVKRVYKDKFTDNPAWHDKDYVEQWWKDLRARKAKVS